MVAPIRNLVAEHKSRVWVLGASGRGSRETSWSESISPLSVNRKLVRPQRQELHASPHIEHIPVLSYPYMDMWATMKFWPSTAVDFFLYELFFSERASDAKRVQNNFSLFIFLQRHPLAFRFFFSNSLRLILPLIVMSTNSRQNTKKTDQW